MALSDPRFGVVLTYAETSGKEVTREYVTDETITSYDDFVVEWALRRAEVIGMTDSVLVAETHKIFFVEESITLPASAENSDQALISAKLVGKRDSGTMSIPAAKATLFAAATGANYDVVDTADTLVSHFLDMFSATGKWVVSDGDKWIKATAAGKRRNVKTTGS